MRPRARVAPAAAFLLWRFVLPLFSHNPENTARRLRSSVQVRRRTYNGIDDVRRVGPIPLLRKRFGQSDSLHVSDAMLCR
jgi:hypothetical protein